MGKIAKSFPRFDFRPKCWLSSKCLANIDHFPAQQNVAQQIDAARFFSIQTPLINNGHGALNAPRSIEFVSGSGQSASLRIHASAAGLWPEHVRHAKKNVSREGPSAPSNSKNQQSATTTAHRRSPALARQTIYSCQTFLAVISTNVSHPSKRLSGVGVLNRPINALPWARGVQVVLSLIHI